MLGSSLEHLESGRTSHRMRDVRRKRDCFPCSYTGGFPGDLHFGLAVYHQDERLEGSRVLTQAFALVKWERVTVPPLFFNKTRLTIQPPWYSSNSPSGFTSAFRCLHLLPVTHSICLL